MLRRRFAPLALALAAAASVAAVTASLSPAAPSPDKDAAATTTVATRPTTQFYTRMRSPQETIASIQLPPGYRLELVASEPDIVNPVCLAWDGDGAMYVCEMRTYMLDIDAKGEMEPKSRVSRLESTKGDGVYDRITTFADNLLLPRQVLPLDDRILIRETNTKDIYEYRDADGDGVSEPRTRFYEGGRAQGNLEHQAAHLTWNLDNWMYQTVDQHRLRFAGGKLVVEANAIPFKTGQWGYATRDDGGMILTMAGTERPAHDFQAPLVYGRLPLPNELADKFTQCFPLVKLADVQGGPKRVWPAGGLNHFSGTAGPSIYRGDALPKDLYGDYILPEPVGRLIRRAKVTDVDGKLVISKAEPGETEFMNSTDANFRPVFSATGPDGLLYIVDMYHGIIQEGNWTQKGSYLRDQILKLGLEKNVGAGRIYRLVHESHKPNFAKPRMLKETPAQLVKHLAHANGWWRDTAQKLIVLKGDKSVIPALKHMAATDKNPLARLHALWTLEGLDSANLQFLIAQLKDADPAVRAAAIRIGEPLIKKNDPAFMAAINALASDPNPQVVKQYLLSLLHTAHPQADAVAKAALAAKPANAALPAIVKQYKDNALQAMAAKLKPRHLDNRFAGSFMRGKDLYAQACVACHGDNGLGTPAPEDDGTTLAPPLKGSKQLLADKSVPIHVVLKGMVGPHENGKAYVNEMATFAWFDDATLASILTYVRNDWGNQASPIEARDVKDVRTATATRDKPYTFPEIAELLAKATKPKAADKPAADKDKDKKPAPTEKPNEPAKPQAASPKQAEPK
jgi:mono/diheme cytochrome c family protein